jgi:hypothetical protein
MSRPNRLHGARAVRRLSVGGLHFGRGLKVKCPDDEFGLTHSLIKEIVVAMIDRVRNLLAASVLSLMACGSSTPSDGGAGLDARRGADVAVSDAAPSAFTIRVSTDPDPPRIGPNTSFQLTIAGADGKAVVGATVDVTWLMPTMPDMGGTATVTEQGNGVYLADGVSFSMEGSWKVTVVVNAAGQKLSKDLTYDF